MSAGESRQPAVSLVDGQVGWRQGTRGGWDAAGGGAGFVGGLVGE
jgi:hypothetical protein